MTTASYGTVTTLAATETILNAIDGSATTINTVGGTVDFKTTIAPQFNKPSYWSKIARRYSFGEFGIDAVIREETEKCRIAAVCTKQIHKTDGSCPAWKDDRKKIMEVSLLFTPFSALQHINHVNTTNFDGIEKFRLNKKTPAWLIAAMAAQYNQGTANNQITVGTSTTIETVVLLDSSLSAIVKKIDEVKKEIADDTDQPTFFKEVVDKMVDEAGLTDDKQKAAAQKLAYSMFGTYMMDGTAAKYIGTTTTNTLNANPNYTFCGRFAIKPNDEFKPRYYRIFIYVALVNEATNEAISWRNLDTVYDSVGINNDKRVVYNRYFDEVE